MKQSAEVRSALEFFATAQSCRERQFQSTLLSLAVWLELAQLHVLRNWKETEAYKNDDHLLPIEFDEKVVKLRLPALGTVLTVFGEKDPGNEKFLVRRARVRDDSASAGWLRSARMS